MGTSAADAITTLGRVIPDFPSPGIQFLDLTPVLADADALAAVSHELVAPFLGGVDYVAGVEARGFAFAAAAAAATAASPSSGPADASDSIGSPVAGSTTSKCRRAVVVAMT